MKVLIVPKEGIQVRIPHTKQVLPPEGAKLNMTHYWKRRENDGDVFIHAIGE